MVRLPRNEKHTYRLNSKASNVTIRFDLDHNLDLSILKIKRDLDLWPHTWHWPWIFMVKFWNSCISEWEGRLTLHKGGGSRSFMTMIMTIWWPWSGVWIYQIVTGVTSVVGVPSTTHLVQLPDRAVVTEMSHLRHFTRPRDKTACLISGYWTWILSRWYKGTPLHKGFADQISGMKKINVLVHMCRKKAWIYNYKYIFFHTAMICCRESPWFATYLFQRHVICNMMWWIVAGMGHNIGASQKGYPWQWFTEDCQRGIDQKGLNCSLCKLVLRDAVQTRSCGSRFCKACYEGLFK